MSKLILDSHKFHWNYFSLYKHFCNSRSKSTYRIMFFHCYDSSRFFCCLNDYFPVNRFYCMHINYSCIYVFFFKEFLRF